VAAFGSAVDAVLALISLMMSPKAGKGGIITMQNWGKAASSSCKNNVRALIPA
jgi:hypothetical protein